MAEGNEDGVGLTPFQCFAHSPDHIAAAAAAAADLSVVAQEGAVHEYHHGEPVIALVVTPCRGTAE